MNYIKHSAEKFAKTLKLRDKNISLKKLKALLTKSGFFIKYYSESQILLISLGLLDEANDSDSVSFVDSQGMIYIFIDDTLPEPKQLFALAHETGHIILKHRKTQSLKKQQEREADLFAHYLLSGNGNRKLNIAISAVSLFLCACIILITVLAAFPTNKQQTKTVSAEIEDSSKNSNIEINNTVCYFTKYGEVYHIYRDCYYIKNSNNVYCDTIEHSHKDRLCSACAIRNK
ncbi:MAG: ImmA/IrrE family metallo-endopeptidase [Clostridia bacterium]|nr:ImmA/IrrE family metallo-endopeptidase [Clostridia bacterium]